MLAYTLAFRVSMATDWVVSTTGTSAGSGTISNPLSLSKALGDDGGGTSPVQPGDTILLRGGTYYDTNSFTGTIYTSYLAPVGSPIVVRPYLSELPVIQATVTNHNCLIVVGSNTWFQGFELWNSGLPRGLARSSGILMRSPGSKLINLVIHDSGNGIYNGEESLGSEIYGCLIYNYGIGASPGSHGIYSHSTAPDGVLIKNNVVLNGFYYAIHCYSETSSQLDNLTIVGNICSEAGNLWLDGERRPNYLVGGSGKANDLLMIQNAGYLATTTVENNALIGYSTFENGTMTVASNYFYGGSFAVNHWTNMNVLSNTLTKPKVAWAYNPSADLTGTKTWDGNTYYSDIASPMTLSGVAKTYSDWKTATGFDASSSLSITDPAVTVSFVRTNNYEIGRANIAVFNWAGSDNVSVDVSGVVPAGWTYAVRNAADWNKSIVASGVYAGGAISLPMTNLTAAVPVGATAGPVTGPAFNAFIMQSTPPPSSMAVQMRFGQLRGAP